MPVARLALVPLLASMLLLGACGSPGPADDDFTFTFDPVPYTVVVPPPEARDQELRLISVAENGAQYKADQVAVILKVEHFDEFERWTQKIGFRVLERSKPRIVRDTTLVVVLVPPGSVLDAAKVIQRRPGVIEAGPGYIFESD